MALWKSNVYSIQSQRIGRRIPWMKSQHVLLVNVRKSCLVSTHSSIIDKIVHKPFLRQLMYSGGLETLGSWDVCGILRFLPFVFNGKKDKTSAGRGVHGLQEYLCENLNFWARRG